MAAKVRFGRWHLSLPRSQIARMVIGAALILGGLMGFLPVLGFWMIPLGLLVLSVDLPIVRRWRRQATLWWERRRRGDGTAAARRSAANARPGPGASGAHRRAPTDRA